MNATTEAPVESAAKKNEWRTPLAAIVSVGWLALAMWWTFYRPCSALAVPTMALNEWGDWAAGTFAPLAFLWLVVGYLQQGEELRDNVRALHLQEKALQLQVQELKESVEQQTAAARAATRQADMLEKSQEIALRSQVLAHQPRFVEFRHRSFASATGATAGLGIVNKGRPCYDARARISNGIADGPLAPVTNRHWGTDTEHTFALPLLFESNDVIVVVSYTDELLVHQEQSFTIAQTDQVEIGHSFEVELLHMSFNLPVSVDDLI